MNNEDYRRGYNDALWANTKGVSFGEFQEDLSWVFGKAIRIAPFLSVLWFWGFYPMVAALGLAFFAKAVWPERFWEGGRKWWLLGAFALLPYLGHAAFGIPAAVHFSQHPAAVQAQKVAGKGEH